MSGEKWILVDTRVSREKARRATTGDDSTTRYFGSNFAWTRTLKEAKPFKSRSEAEPYAKAEWHAVRRVVPAGTKRARAAAQAAEDNVATMRAELEGLRATDEEMAQRLAQAQADLAAAEQRAKDIEARRAAWEAAYTLAQRREEIMCDVLGVRSGECIDHVAKRVVAERDEARRDLGELRRAIEVLTRRIARPAA